MALAEKTPDGRITVYTDIRERHLVKLVPGIRYRAAEQVWHAPLSWASCVALRGVFRDQLQVGPELTTWATQEVATRVQPSLYLRDLQDAPPPANRADLPWDNLYPFQRVGVSFLATARQALLADEMGTGKTIQAAVAARLFGKAALPLLVVCPNVVKFNWQKELEKWWPGLRVAVVGGSATKRRETIAELRRGELDALIINWEVLRYHSKLGPYGYVRLKGCENCDPKAGGKPLSCEREPKELNEIEWQCVIADEAHRAKEPTAKRTRALWAVSRNAPLRFALTGTPIANSLEDLWSLLHFVSPEEWPAKTAFLERYALQSWNPFGSMVTVGVRPDTREEFFRVLDPRFLRRTKEAVLKFLPPKVYTTRYVEMSAKQKKAYEQMRKTQVAELADGEIIVAAGPLKKALRLRQFAAACGELGEPGPDGKRPVLLTEPSCKADALVEIVEELGDKQLVVFSESEQLIQVAARRLEREKISHGVYTGRTADTREEAREQFERGELQVLLLTTQTGGTGLNLQNASVAVYLQRPWSFIDDTQSEDRLHRIGQMASHVEYIDLVVKGTVEEKVLESLEEKGQRFEDVARDKETVAKWLS